jgi:hypothetical protein
MNCWEFKNCPEETYKKCPAYPYGGLDCWKVTGTKCDRGKYEMASLEEKVLFCRKECAFYKEYAHKY